MSLKLNWKKLTLNASRALNLVSDEVINHVLLALADEAVIQTEQILLENAKDLAAMEKSNPM